MWQIDVCDVTRSCMWRDSFMCVTWQIDVCDVTRSCVWHDSFMCVTWLVHVCDVTRSCGWRDSFMCVTWLIRSNRTIDHTDYYRVATISRLLKIIGLFCKRALSNRLYSAKETYNFKEPANRSHPIWICEWRGTLAWVMWFVCITACCSVLQCENAATRCNTLQYAVTCCNTGWLIRSHCTIDHKPITTYKNVCNVTRPYEWLDMFMCVTWRSCAWRDTFEAIAPLIILLITANYSVLHLESHFSSLKSQSIL